MDDNSLDSFNRKGPFFEGAMKLLVNGSFLMKTVKGVQRYAYELIHALSRVGFEHLRIVAPPSCTQSRLHGYEIIVDPLRIGWFGQWWLWEQLRLPSIAGKFPEWILWSPTNIGPVAVKKQVVTLHDALVFAKPHFYGSMRMKYYRWVFRHLGRRSMLVVTDSAFSRDELIRYGIARAEKIYVVPCGVSDIFRPKQLSDKKASTRYVLTLGSRDPRKNIARLIDAWKMIDTRIKDKVKLVVVGGNIKSTSDDCDLGVLPADVQVLRDEPDSSIVQLYQDCLFFIFPSLYEGFGLPPLEAMACGAPIVVSNAASLPELCQEAALYFDPTDVDDIAKKMELLLCDANLRSRKRELSIARARQYSWDTAAHKLVTALENL